MARKIDDDTLADRVPRDRGAAATGGDGHPVSTGDVEDRDDVGAGARENNDARGDAVVRGVRGVLNEAAARIVDLTGDRLAEVGH